MPRKRLPRSVGDPTRIWICDLCGHRMLDLHCKLTCKGCGYRRDCSDP